VTMVHPVFKTLVLIILITIILIAQTGILLVAVVNCIIIIKIEIKKKKCIPVSPNNLFVLIR